jgi:hypothetical protein
VTRTVRFKPEAEQDLNEAHAYHEGQRPGARTPVVTRSQLIDRIRALSEADLARVAPFLEADLDALVDLDDLREEVRRGRESARSQPLVEDDEVVQSILRRLG